MEFTVKQENFCQYYVDCEGNASEAYRMAYNCENMKKPTINKCAYDLMQNPKITTRIADIKERRAKATENKRKVVEDVLMDIVTTDPNDLYIEDPKSGKIKLRSPRQLPKRARNAMKKISNEKGKVTYEFNGKTEAAKLLASMNGWNAPQQVSISGKNGEKANELRIGFDEE